MAWEEEREDVGRMDGGERGPGGGRGEKGERAGAVGVAGGEREAKRVARRDALAQLAYT